MFFTDLDRWHRSVLGELSRGFQRTYPGIRLYQNNERATVLAEVPGVNPDTIDVTVQDDQLTLKAEKNTEKPEGAREIRSERPEGSFTRVVSLPFRVDSNQVNAKYSNGVLEVSLPRAEEDKPRKIAVAS